MSLDEALKDIENEIAGKNNPKKKALENEDEQDDDEEDEIIEGYTINKDVIIQAWAVYRPKIEYDEDGEEEKEEDKSNASRI